jgi:hypothetical protein
MLDELSTHGLEVWRDDCHRWQWRWTATALQSERGFWALGEAIVDSFATRFPAAFNGRNIEDSL